MRRTISTARSLVAFIGGHLPRRTDAQHPVVRFYVDRIEEANLLEAYDVLEIPAHQRIDSGNRGQGNVLHVGTPPRAKDLPGLVLRDQPENLRRHWQHR